MKHNHHLIYGLFVVLLLLPLSAAAQTSSGSGGDAVAAEEVLTLPILDPGEVIEDSFSGNVTAKLYAFNGLAGERVTISMTQDADSSLDPYIVLLGPAGQVIAADDDSGTEFLSSLIDGVELPFDGSYFILASSYGFVNSFLRSNEELEEDLAYTLTAAGFSGTSETSSFRYLAGDLFPGEVTTGNSTAEEPVIFYVFNGRAGDVIDITLTSDDFDTVLHVFASGGERIAADDDGGGSTNSALTGVELTEDGVYLVFATDLYFIDAVEESSSFDGGMFEITLEVR